jgi:hypothetical protein
MTTASMKTYTLHAPTTALDLQLCLALVTSASSSSSSLIKVTFTPHADPADSSIRLVSTADASSCVVEGTVACAEWLVRHVLPAKEAALWMAIAGGEEISLVQAQVYQWMSFAVSTVQPAMSAGDQGAQKNFAKV